MADLALTMPKMSMTMEEGTMVSWLKKPGDPIREGEVVCEVATDKVDMEVESPFEGVLARIVAEVGDAVPVGEPIGFITTDADDLLGGLFDGPDASTGSPVETESAAHAAHTETTAPRSPGSDRVRAVPLARSMAAEWGIDLHTLTPTGPWHTVRVADVETATGSLRVVAPPAAPSHVAPAPVAHRPEMRAPEEDAAAPVVPGGAEDPTAGRARRMRAQIAKVMTASALVPQFTAYADLDLGPASRIRHELLDGASWTVLLLRAHAIALSRVPALTARWESDAIVPIKGIGVALAVDSPAGLIAPVIRDPHRRPIAELVADVRDAVAAARAGTTGLDRLSGGTTVLSNLGGMGVRQFNALLTPPHATALSTGSVGERVDAIGDGRIAVRTLCTVGITVDHRVTDGADAGRYLSALQELFAHPQSLAESV
ncbi:MAG: 2-oxo acid dehydrogenase subunit E2 [Micrococcales bacterium]|nr:2-oxo acid dehydrogenase subunit E2 [Micrococcales bacterium]